MRALRWLPLALAVAALAADGTALDRFLDGLTTLRTDFTQTVTDAHGQVTERGHGQLLVARPGKFRWDYQPDGQGDAADSGQLLVADGKRLWFFDRELAQVTVKPMEAALSATPMVLLSGSGAQMREAFDLHDAATHDGLAWLEVSPRAATADFKSAQLGFSGERLVRMTITDKLGQTVAIQFDHSERNAHLDPGALQFTPPKGVDVIGNTGG